ncbi:MAG: type 4a pilus biogenesis protein PilO [Planctomycetota bacterium]
MRFGLRELIFLLVLLAMPGAAYFFVFQPKNQLQQDARAEIGAKKAKLNALDKATEQFINLDQEIVRLKTAIRVIEEKLPDDRETYVVVNRVADLAREHNLKVETIKPDKVVSAGPFASELPIRMEFKGGFEGFYRFMLEVERMPRITQVPLMTLERSEDKKDPEGTMIAEMTLSIFFESEAGRATSN